MVLGEVGGEDERDEEVDSDVDDGCRREKS